VNLDRGDALSMLKEAGSLCRSFYAAEAVSMRNSIMFSGDGC